LSFILSQDIGDNYALNLTQIIVNLQFCLFEVQQNWFVERDVIF